MSERLPQLCTRTTRSPRSHDSGVVMPSPVVLLSVVAVAMAAVAFFVTTGEPPKEREITPAAAPATTPSAAPSAAAPVARKKKQPKPVRRGQVYVVVFNNSGITGLAGSVSDQVAQVGWNVVGADNWYGTIPATTVYFPPRLEAAAKQLALDLGIKRTAPAVDPMKMDRLTVILTDPLD
jgi:hypothetical protein